MTIPNKEHMNLKRKSKFLSFLLRHNPEKFDLEMDKYGFVSLHELSEKTGITEETINFIVKEDYKGRYSIVNNKIRANYGHSIPVGDIYADIPPAPLDQLPKTLYHGTPSKNIKSIKEKGLLPMKRKYVHLSASTEWAVEVGLRMDKSITIIEIDVQKAYDLAVKFWFGSLSTIVSTPIPPEVIHISDYQSSVSNN